MLTTRGRGEAGTWPVQNRGWTRLWMSFTMLAARRWGLDRIVSCRGDIPVFRVRRLSVYGVRYKRSISVPLAWQEPCGRRTWMRRQVVVHVLARS